VPPPSEWILESTSFCLHLTILSFPACCRYEPFLVKGSVDVATTVVISFIALMVNTSPTAYPDRFVEYFCNVLYPLLVMILFVMFLIEVRSFYHGISWSNLRGVAQFDWYCRTIKLFSFVAFCMVKTAKVRPYLYCCVRCNEMT
jgi:hypothetical protein